MYSITIETKFIKTFILKENQDRYLKLISSSKSRKKFLEKLFHFSDFISQKFEKLNKDELKIIRKRIEDSKRIQECYMISYHGNLDGIKINVQKAVSEIIGHNNGTIYIFGDMDFIYYEGEDERLISKTINLEIV